MSVSRKFTTSLMAAVTGGLLSTAAQAVPFFTGLGDLPGGAVQSAALLFDNAVSNDGTTVVGRSTSASGSEAFRWTQAGGMVGLGDLAGGSFFSQANSTSADGSVVVGQGRSASGFEAFRWTQGGGMVGLGDLAGGGFSSGAYSTSADGSVVVGGSGSASGNEAFRWTQAGGMVGLGDLAGGSFFSRAYSTSADGSVVVGLGRSASGFEAFRWTQGGGMVGLGDLDGGGFSSGALSTSADGSVVVGYSNSGSDDEGQAINEAFRWTQGGGMVGLGFLATGGGLTGGIFRNSLAFSTSADGSVVVGESSYANGATKAFIWDAANGMQLLEDVLVTDFGLDLTGWSGLTTARGVSDDGLVVAGYGVHNGVEEAFIVNMREDDVVAASAPSMTALFALGLVGLGYLRRKRTA